MTRTNIDVSDELVDRAVRTFGLRTKREMVHLALERLLGGGPMSVEEQFEIEGTGWEGNLDTMRTNRFGDWDCHADR